MSLLGQDRARVRDTVLQVISLHRGLDEQLLPPRIAAIELMTTAAHRRRLLIYVFCAHALHQDPAGCRAMLDLHGTHHDERQWQDPETFHPGRFLNGHEDGYDFVPQGGGTHDMHHRCPGEWVTLALMRVAVEFLTREIDYRCRICESTPLACPRCRAAVL